MRSSRPDVKLCAKMPNAYYERAAWLTCCERSTKTNSREEVSLKSMTPSSSSNGALATPVAIFGLKSMVTQSVSGCLTIVSVLLRSPDAMENIISSHLLCGLIDTCCKQNCKNIMLNPSQKPRTIKEDQARASAQRLHYSKSDGWLDSPGQHRTLRGWPH